jgi:hypothetical protein
VPWLCTEAQRLAPCAALPPASSRSREGPEARVKGLLRKKYLKATYIWSR